MYRQLKKSNISFCGISHPKLPDEVKKNTSILYYRFHGVPTLYKSEYNIDFVKKIADDIKTAGRIKDAYVYFNNTWGTGGINNARQMQNLI